MHRGRLIEFSLAGSDLAYEADDALHVPLRPKSDLVLLYGLAHVLFDRGAVKRVFARAPVLSIDQWL